MQMTKYEYQRNYIFGMMMMMLEGNNDDYIF